MNIEDLEQRIGTPPGDQAFRLTSANKELVREWLVAKGFDAARASVVRENTLLRAYTIPRYLHEMLTRGDYNSSVARKPWQRSTAKPVPEPKAPEPHYCNGCGWEILVGETRCNNPNCPGDQPIPAPDQPKCPQCGAVHDDCEHSLCHKCRTAPAAEPLNLGAFAVPAPKEPTPMPPSHVTNAVPTVSADNPANMLTAAIQAIAGQGITEARMIELIHEHVPAIVRQCLSDAFASIAVNLE